MPPTVAGAKAGHHHLAPHRLVFLTFRLRRPGHPDHRHPRGSQQVIHVPAQFLFLPQVAVEQGWDARTFLSAVCRKAGYPDRAWEDPDARLYRFTAQAASEDDAGAGDRGRSDS